MNLLAVVLLVVAVSGADRSDVSHYEDLLHVIHTNCTQGLVELLLLLQDTRLGTINTVLEQIHEALLQTHQPATVCRPGWHLIAGRCLKVFLSLKMSWADARQHCQANGGDLATVHDANALADTITYVNINNPERINVNFWLGGTDKDNEGVWTWVTGELMPRGAPFWGSINGYIGDPSGGTGENCAGLYQIDKYYIHDFSCDLKFAPLCQMP